MYVSMLGRKLLMKFNVNGKTEWFKGIENAYDGLTGKYDVYFLYVTNKQCICWRVTKTSDFLSGT